MRIFQRLLLMVAAAMVGLAAGLMLRGKPGAGPIATKTRIGAKTPVAARAGSSFRRIHQGPGAISRDDSPLATKLERDIAMSSGVTRWLCWLDAIERAAPSDFPRLARLTHGNSTALRLVATRWIDLDPRDLFDTLVTAPVSGSDFPSQDLASQLFSEWPKRDPKAMIAALNEPGAIGPRGEWRRDVATTLVNKDPELGLRLMSEWHIENYGPNTDAIVKWAAANPRHAAEFTLAHPAGFASQIAIEAIGREWARTDPAGALEFAASQPGLSGWYMGKAALKDWAARNLDQAADWLARADPLTRINLSPSFVESWAKRDVAAALGWCESNLTGSSLAQAVGGVMKGAAAKDVALAAGWVEQMNPSPARVEAALKVAETWFPDFSADKPVAPETISWLSSLDARTVKGVMDHLSWRWSNSDPKSMAAFLESLTTDQSQMIASQTYTTLARNMARKNPSEALEWAGRLPEQPGLSAGSDAFGEWRQYQPEAAMNWWSRLPSTDRRRTPFFRKALEIIANDPHGADQIAALSPPQRSAARSILETLPLEEERRTRLLEALTAR